MSNKPKIKAFCAAGCAWETVHLDDFLKSATFYEVGQPDGYAAVDAYRKYRIFSDSDTNTGKYTATIEFQSPDATGENFVTQNTFTVPTGYRNYFDFEIMQAQYNGAMLRIAYEVNGEADVLNVNLATTAHDLTKSRLKITGASQVLIYNDTAAILGKDGGYYVPSIADNGDGTATITFEASEEGMPEITPVTFPVGVGDDGKSAYEIYLDNGGTIGTETEWIESLNGEDGESFYDMCVKNGFVGSETDLIIAMRGEKGATGATPIFITDEIVTLPAGSSAYVTIHNDDPENPVIDFGIPQGAKGDKGDTGATGATGKTAYEYAKDGGYTGTEAEFAPMLANATDSRKLSLGIASDGLIYIFADGTPVGTGIPQGQSGDVFGYVDETNTVVLTGNLADGTYTIKYEVEDAGGNIKTIDIGNMVLDTNVYYSVTSDLTNCSNDNSAKTVVAGSSYVATISANSGYELKSVTVTMGGSAVSVTGGAINIASVTGNIVITAVAEEAAKEPTNFIVYNATNTTDWSIYCTNARVGSDGAYRSSTTQDATNYIAVQNGDEVHWHNMNINSQIIGMYNSSKAKVSAGSTVDLKTNGHIADVTTLNATTNDGQFTITNASVAYIRFTVNRSSYSSLPPSGYTVNIKRNGEWL